MSGFFKNTHLDASCGVCFHCSVSAGDGMTGDEHYIIPSKYQEKKKETTTEQKQGDYYIECAHTDHAALV